MAHAVDSAYAISTWRTDTQILHDEIVRTMEVIAKRHHTKLKRIVQSLETTLRIFDQVDYT
jgi:hypothetical protein